MVSQAHETGSHLQNDTWAWDFRMPVGTPVVAALDGEVRLARGDSTRGGCDPAMARHANYVVVTHADGLETQYLHFSSVIVQPGQKVKAGELLGYSGDTGWACGAHLHFKVTTAGAGWNNPSVRALIRDYGDPQREVLVRAPACANPDIIMASRVPGQDDAPSVPGATPNGVATPAVLTGLAQSADSDGARASGANAIVNATLNGQGLGEDLTEATKPATGSTGLLPGAKRPSPASGKSRPNRVSAPPSSSASPTSTR